MSRTFSIVYPTRHRPEFIRQALRIMETQRHGSFEVIVSDNFVDPALSSEQVCLESSVANLRYVRPPRPVGMVENWSHALQFATGDYVCYLTDKMFVLPDALGRIEQAINAAGGPEIVSWSSDAYNPESYAAYFGAGRYFTKSADGGLGRYRRFLAGEELDRRGRAEGARGEQSSADYARGKIVFGAYRNDLVGRIVDRYGAFFKDISPDYTSMILGLTEARDAIELAGSCVVSINTDISNGGRSDVDDTAALEYLNSLAGGAAQILANMLVPGLYASSHNVVAHDYLTLKKRFDLAFEFNAVNWLVYCQEDIYRPGRRWSSPSVEAAQKKLLRDYIGSLESSVAAAVEERIAARARPKPAGGPWRGRLRRLTPWRHSAGEGIATPSIDVAVAQRAGR
jgi:glycosyltransferase involved in cell wall biosynthesis